MAKLNELGDKPLQPKVAQDPIPPGDSYERWLEAIQEMIDSEKFDWANSTLSDLYDSIGERRWISEGQKKALRNIAEARRWDGLEDLR